MIDRHSYTQEHELVSDPEEKALLEASNALRQYDVSMLMLDRWLEAASRGINLHPSDLLILNRFALSGLSKSAGTFRTTEMDISGSSHKPPPPSTVPALVEDFCEYINRNWSEKTAIHLSAFALWRVNWIHPFVDGNGRTARSIANIILAAKLGYKLPGSKTIPELISENKTPYYEALENADSAFEEKRINLTGMMDLLEGNLATQLLSVHEDASGKSEKSETELECEESGSRESLIVDKSEYELALVPVVMRTVKNKKPTSKSKQPVFEHLERNPVLYTSLFGLITAIIAAIITFS